MSMRILARRRGRLDPDWNQPGVRTASRRSSGKHTAGGLPSFSHAAHRGGPTAGGPAGDCAIGGAAELRSRSTRNLSTFRPPTPMARPSTPITRPAIPAGGNHLGFVPQTRPGGTQLANRPGLGSLPASRNGRRRPAGSGRIGPDSSRERGRLRFPAGRQEIDRGGLSILARPGLAAARH